MHSRAKLLRSGASTWAQFSRHHLQSHIRRASSHASTQAGTQTSSDVNEALHRLGLDPWAGFEVGIEKAVTLPASWYTQAAALQLEKQAVLCNTWQMVCAVSQVQQPGDYLCGTLGDVRYLVVRGQDGQLRAFHNVCRHHAAAVAQGCGNQTSMQFACPYHGWTYDTRGRLVKATRLKGIQDFKATTYGLHPIAVDTWGHFVFIHLQGGAARAAAGLAAACGAPVEPPDVAEWLGVGGSRMHETGMADSSLVHIRRREYVLNCNWKVFADNYLDGGYHVPYAHKDLSSGLDLSGYTNELHEVLSIQSCAVQSTDTASGSNGSSDGTSSIGSSIGSNGGSDNGSNGGSSDPTVQLDRLGGRDAAYAFVYPNFMINRYGPWMDTNLVTPLTGKDVDCCKVTFDYWLDANALQQAAASSSSSSGPGGENVTPVREPESAAAVEAALESQFVQDSLASSHQVQVEDIALCEAVQQGLQDPAYGVGRYAPGPEAPMYHFHSLLYGAVVQHLGASSR